ncbi:Alpha-mannosidase 2 [Pelomyxa schiedti]|nr:Alpha-mannosidase 2 [Pelomyxa schiedti]
MFVDKRIEFTPTFERITLSSPFLQVNFGKTGFLNNITVKGATINFQEQYVFYSSFQSGAYVFLPTSQTILTGDTICAVVQGPVFDEVVTQNKNVIRTATLVHSRKVLVGGYIRMQTHVLVTKDELVVRFNTSISHGDTFYTDVNGFGSSQRFFRDDLPLSASFFPVTSNLFWQDSYNRISVHTSRSLGASCFHDSICELMLDRSTFADDHKGLDEPLSNHAPVMTIFDITIEGLCTSHPVQPSIISRAIFNFLSCPLHIFMGEEVPSPLLWEQCVETSVAPLTGVTFPHDVHLVMSYPRVPDKLNSLACNASQPLSDALQVSVLMARYPTSVMSHVGSPLCPFHGTETRACFNSELLSFLSSSVVYESTLFQFNACGVPKYRLCFDPGDIRSFIVEVPTTGASITLPHPTESFNIDLSISRSDVAFLIFGIIAVFATYSSLVVLHLLHRKINPLCAVLTLITLVTLCTITTYLVI